MLGVAACQGGKLDAGDDDIGVPTTGPVSESSTGDGAASTGDVTGDTSPGGGSSSTGPEDEPEPPVVFDVGALPDAVDYNCGAPTHVVCDGDGEDDPFRTIGRNCPNGPEVDGVYNGDPQSLMVHEGDLGTFVPAPYPPREGDAFLILSSGIANDLTMPGYFAAADVAGFVDNGGNLPAPLSTMAVSPTEDCNDNQALVGSGDCSNTIYGQFSARAARPTTTPRSASSGRRAAHQQPQLNYDFAFFSTEYPISTTAARYNDMYVGWLESESWTGNISFDTAGNPDLAQRRLPRLQGRTESLRLSRRRAMPPSSTAPRWRATPERSGSRPPPESLPGEDYPSRVRRVRPVRPRPRHGRVARQLPLGLRRRPAHDDPGLRIFSCALRRGRASVGTMASFFPSLAVGSAALLSGCGALFSGPEQETSEVSSAGDDGGITQEPLGAVTSWPTFELDCDVSFEGAIRVIQDSGSADTLGFSIGNWTAGAIAGDPRIDLRFRPGVEPLRFDVDRRAAEVASDFDLLVQVGNTTFSNRNPHQGETRGEVVIERFDAQAGVASVELIGVKLLGVDAVYAGDYRCGLSGRLIVELGRGEIGEVCREDYECGGDRAERVLGDFDSLSCAVGCHVDEQCAQGRICEGESCVAG